MLNSKTIRYGPTLEEAEIAVRRPYPKQDPFELCMVFMEGGIGKFATAQLTSPNNWETLYNFGACRHVSIAFRGHWVKSYDGSRDIVTDGEPYIAIVDIFNTLYVRQKYNGVPLKLADNVIKVHMIQGWKSVEPTSGDQAPIDQGLICVYTKNDYNLYYRNYAQQPNGSYLWENERQIMEAPFPITNFGLVRTNDYRVGILVESNNNIYLLPTVRAWAGLGIDPMSVTSTLTDYTVTIQDVTYRRVDDDHIIKTTLSSYTISLLYGLSPLVQSASNPDAFTIELVFDAKIFNVPLPEALSVKDSANISFAIQSVQITAPNILTLHCDDFNNALDDITVTYTGSTSFSGEAVPVDSFTITFTPTGLVPVDVPAPVVVSVINVE